MEQLVQNLKDGNMTLLEVPFPALGKGQVLVRNHYSLISAGTEGKTVRDARMGYLGKARARQNEVKKVIQSVRTLGLKQTYQMVMNRLEAPSSLGYSCAGSVIAVADDVQHIQVGDLVACGGSGAVHAEVVVVPVNLCALIDQSVPLQLAAFTTVGAIALQGIRQADLRLGENCVVIGLGLVGQLTLQLLRASGVNAIGIDLEEGQVELAKKCGFQYSFNRNNPQLEQAVLHLTGGYGSDSVIITAATTSDDPINLAGTLCRRKGKVVMVGAVSPDFERKNFYQKELDLRMSSSYGPGRYDASYEEDGIDYPYAYVRWTEQRNMQAFADLLKQNAIQPQLLLTHTFRFEEAKTAYQLILDRTETFAGIVLAYDIDKELKQTIVLKNVSAPAQKVVAGMIGAGSFGQNFLLPAIQGKVYLKGVATARPNNARNVANKFSFEYCTGNADEIIEDDTVNTLFIATRHDTHAEFVLKGLEKGRNIFVEKPLCLHESELNEIIHKFDSGTSRLMCGFNRRFAPLVVQLKSTLNSAIPVAINYRINAGNIPSGHWIHERNTGGGRIIGEVCHFIDLCAFLSNSTIRSVAAFALQDAQGHQDTVVISLSMQNGSVASISYFSNGNKSEEKEFIEVYNGGLIARIHDFTELHILSPKRQVIKSMQDKGHKQSLAAFIDAIANGKATPIPENELFNSMRATFGVLDSVTANGEVISIQS